MKIFVIDDEEFTRETLKAFLKDKFPEADVVIFKTGEDGMKNLYQKPDLIVLDYYLDNHDRSAENGAAILRKIKGAMPKIPVVLLSSADNPSVAADTIMHGAYDYIVKNESAYHRLQIIIERMYGYGDIHREMRTQKTMNMILLIVFVIFLMMALYIRFAH